MRFISVSIICLSFITFACRETTTRAPKLTEEQQEFLEDSLDFVVARALQDSISLSIHADVETGNVQSPMVDDDAADDMAIWVNPADTEKSLFIGTNKKGGVMVFNLKGEELGFYPTGRINNIDVMYGYPLGKEKIDLVGCTNRSDQSIDLFRINPADGALSDIAAHSLKVDTALVKDVYGFCFYFSTKPYLFVNGKNGVVQQFEIVTTREQKLDLKLVRQVNFNTQTEGMVADELYKVLYVGEEDKGIWKLGAEPDSPGAPVLLANSGEENANITYDIEGLALYKKGDRGYLLASSQGNFSYAVFERKTPNQYLGSFKIADGPAVDGVEETDGIDVVSIPLGPLYPQGLFAAQDGFNYENGKLQRQNFKLVSWEKIARALNLTD